MQWKRKVQTIGTSLMVIIPKDLAIFLDIRRGDQMIFEDVDKKLSITHVKQTIEELAGDEDECVVGEHDDIQ